MTLATRLFACWLSLVSFVYAPPLFAQAELEGITNILTGKASDTPTEAAPTPDRVIETDTDAQDDRKIRQRLTTIFSELDSMANVTVTVSHSIVTLTGEVDSADVESRALKFARQIDGVVGVENHLSVDRSISRRLEATRQKILTTSKDILANLPLLVLAILVLIAFAMLGNWISHRKSLYQRLTKNEFIADLLSQITRLAFTMIGVVLALSLLDATPLLGTLLGAAGIIGLSISFAVRDTVENYIASILLSIRNPFEVNDLIRLENYEGRVARLNSRATILLSPDGNHIRIPNAMVFKAVITNYTRNPLRRFNFNFRISANQELLDVQALALKVLANLPGVLTQPAPAVLVQNVIGSDVELNLSGWVDQTHNSHDRVRSEAIRQVKETFEDKGVVIVPNAVYKVQMLSREEAQAASEETSPLPDEQSVNKHYSKQLTDVSTQSDDDLKAQIKQEQMHTKDGENLLKPETRKE